MKKMLMLGTSYLSKEMVLYAKSQGVYTIVTDPQPLEKSVAKQVADEYWMINTCDLDKIENKCRKENISAVLCGISEFNLEMTMALCERLGLPCYCTPSAWKYSRDKAAFKELCKRIGAPVATDYYLSEALNEEELDRVAFPVVVKPVDLSANRGVSYCYNKQELIEAYHYARTLSKSDKIVVEKMLFGKEWYSYYAIANGEIRLVALNGMYAQTGELKNLYSLTTTVSDNVERFINEINPQIIEVLKEVGCKEGIAWVQVMLDEDDRFYIIEMGYRLPGDFPFIQYEKLFNYNSVSWIVDYALGKKHSIEELPEEQKHAFIKCGCSYSLWTKQEGILAEIRGIEELLQVLDIKYYTLSQKGDHFAEHSTVGVIVFCEDNCENMCKTLDIINKKLSVIDEKGEDVLIRYTDFDYLKQIYNIGLQQRNA